MPLVRRWRGKREARGRREKEEEDGEVGKKALVMVVCARIASKFGEVGPGPFLFAPFSPRTPRASSSIPTSLLKELLQPLLCLILLLPQPDQQDPTPLERLVLAQSWALAMLVLPVAKVLHRLARVLNTL